jgi:AcrR family transcriptional regulator
MSVSPHIDKRARLPQAETRLEAALLTLTGPQSTDPAAKAVTVTELCRLAGVSRNSLYRDYPDVLKKFHHHQKQCRRVDVSAIADRSRQLRAENAAQRKQLAQLAALVDHYWLAYQEASSMLARRERELADLRRALRERSDLTAHPKIVVRNRMLTPRKDT